MDKKEEISEKVNALIEKNVDAQKGFNKAQENAESDLLKAYLLKMASERLVFANNLSIGLKSYNPDFQINPEGSLTGSLHRTWIDIKTAIIGEDDESILAECIRGERASVEEYKEFLENYPTANQEISTTIKKQLDTIQESLEDIKTLEDL